MSLGSRRVRTVPVVILEIPCYMNVDAAHAFPTAFRCCKTLFLLVRQRSAANRSFLKQVSLDFTVVLQTLYCTRVLTLRLQNVLETRAL